MKVIKLKLLILCIFLNFINIASAIKIEKNNYYSGTIKDNHRNNIPLPPGEWLVTEIVSDKIQGKQVTAGLISYTFENPEIGVVWYRGPTGHTASADRWLGNKTPTYCEDNPITGKTKIYGKNNIEWCAFYDGPYIQFLNYTVQDFREYLHLYYINKDVLKDTSKSTIHSIGTQIFDQVRKNKSGDLGFLSRSLDFNKSTNFSSSQTTIIDMSTYTDYRICSQATSLNGKTWEKFPEKYYNEAMARNLTISKCNDLTKRINVSENFTPNQDLSAIENKLSELKNLLDKNLISQEQYDEKSSAILEEF